MPYADQFDLSAVASATTFGTERSFRLNSLYDPDFTSTGHQPYGFDQIAALYMRNQVDEVQINITFSDPSQDGLYVGVFMKNFTDTNTLSGATISQAMERPTVWVQPLNGTGSQVARFSKRVKVWELLGLTKTQYDGSWTLVGSLNTTNPSISPYLSVAVADGAGSASAPAVRCSIDFEYYCTFFARNMVAQS